MFFIPLTRSWLHTILVLYFDFWDCFFLFSIYLRFFLCDINISKTKGFSSYLFQKLIGSSDKLLYCVIICNLHLLRCTYIIEDRGKGTNMTTTVKKRDSLLMPQKLTQRGFSNCQCVLDGSLLNCILIFFNLFLLIFSSLNFSFQKNSLEV